MDISGNDINTNPSKIELTHANPPQNFGELRRFLGDELRFETYKYFFEKNAKLRELFKKNKLFLWKKIQQYAFDNLKT